MPEDVSNLIGKINPDEHFTLVEWVNHLREIYEEEPGEFRPEQRGIALMMLIRDEDNKYEINQVVFVPEIPDLGAVMSLVGSLYIKESKHDAALVATDSWGLPLHLRDQQAEEQQTAHEKLMRGEITPEEYGSYARAFRDKWGVPADYPQDVRTEVSTYVCAANDGSFVAAEQLRGKEHELYWYGGADSPSPDNVWLDDQLSRFIRKIVDKTNRKDE